MSDWLGLKGKTAVVTGGAMGVGKAVCMGLAEAGVNVAAADVNEQAGRQTVEELRAQFCGDPLFLKVDVTSKASVEAMVETVVGKFGSIDILVNNAGIDIPRLLVDPAGKEEMTEEIWDRTMLINMKGFFLCAQAAGRVMVKNGAGVIINMSSESGLEGSEAQSVYAATKAAGYSLTRSWSKELGRHGVRVAGLAPGILEATALRSEEYERALAYARGITVEKLREGYKKLSIPLGREGKLKEVADAVCFLASDRAAYIHGTVINLSGGKSRG